MADYLVYWKTYWQHVEEENRASAPGWVTDNKGFYDRIRKNDRIWVVVTGGDSAPAEWRLLYWMRVTHVDPKRAKTVWGRYGITGSRKDSRAFYIERQPDLTAILWMLQFSTGRHIRSIGQKIGQSLQTHGHRTLTESDVVLWESYAKCLRKA